MGLVTSFFKVRRDLSTTTIACAALILIGRVLTLGALGLTDPSEGRFASAAWHMLQTGDWIVPQINYGRAWENYLAKPPLHVWLTALSFWVLGASEFAARFPSFIAYCLTAVMIFLFARRNSLQYPLVSSCVFLSSLGPFFLGTATITDPTLSLLYFASGFCMCESALNKDGSKWIGYLGFVFIGLAILTKGPVIFALLLIAALIQLTLSGDLAPIKRIPCLVGICLALAVPSIWFLAAESRVPGFFRYYILNENIMRYLSRTADVHYGSLKSCAYGSILIFFLMTSLPFGPWLALRSFSHLSSFRNKVEPRLAFLIGITLAPLIFFALARNILPTYSLLSVPGASILIAKMTAPRVWRERLVTFCVALLVTYIGAISIVAHMFPEKVSIRPALDRLMQESEPIKLSVIGKFPQALNFYTESGIYPSIELNRAGECANCSHYLVHSKSITESLTGTHLLGEYGAWSLYKNVPE